MSIDTVDPTITGATDRAANGNGWYDAPVTVGFTCDDALSGIADCTSPVRLGEGWRPARRGHRHRRRRQRPPDRRRTARRRHDGADPRRRGSPASRTTPAGTAATSPSPGPRVDDLSGLDGAGTRPTARSAARAAPSPPARRSATWPATGPRPPAPRSRSTAPPRPRRSRTSPTGATTPSPSTLTAGDNLSGRRRHALPARRRAGQRGHQRHDRHRGRAHAPGVERGRGRQRRGAAERRGEDRHDGSAASTTPRRRPPTTAAGTTATSPSPSAAPTAAPGSPTAPSPVTRGEGAAQRVVGTATDKAGNTATDETTVNVDETRPTRHRVAVGARRTRTAGSTRTSSATFTCADQDALSGVRSCPAARDARRGPWPERRRHCHRRRGQRQRPLPDHRDRRRRDPSDPQRRRHHGAQRERLVPRRRHGPLDRRRRPVGHRAGARRQHGHRRGRRPRATAAVSDLAGNTRAATVGGIRIDRTAPSTHATAPTGWQSSDVTVRLDATDGLSGVAVTRYTVDGGDPQDGTSVTIDREGTHQVSFWSVDEAGNKETPSTVTVLVDKTAPTITGRRDHQPERGRLVPAPRSRWRSAAATPSAASPPASPTPRWRPRARNSVTGTAVDNAGNKGSVTVGGIDIDTVAPSVSIGGVKDGATYVVGAVPTATVTATDATSGLAAPGDAHAPPAAPPTGSARSRPPRPRPTGPATPARPRR